jgi:hypothetical protein
MIVSGKLVARVTGLDEAHGKVTVSRGKIWFFAYKGDTLQSNMDLLEFSSKTKKLIAEKTGGITIEYIESTGVVNVKSGDGTTSFSGFYSEEEAVVELAEKLIDRGVL